MIGKAPHIAEFAWLNVMYPCITEAEVCDLEKKLGCAIPEVYRNFLMNVSNGFDIMNCTLALHGCRIMRCDSDSGKKLIKSMVLRTADRQGMC